MTLAYGCWIVSRDSSCSASLLHADPEGQFRHRATFEVARLVGNFASLCRCGLYTGRAAARPKQATNEDF